MKGAEIDTIRAKSADGDRAPATAGPPLLSGRPLGWEATITASSEPLGWDGVTAKRFRSAPGEHYFPTVPEDMASVYLGQPVRSARWSADGSHEGIAVRGDVTVKVAGQPSGWRFDEDVDVLVVRFAPTFLGRVAEETGLDADTIERRGSGAHRPRDARRDGARRGGRQGLRRRFGNRARHAPAA